MEDKNFVTRYLTPGGIWFNSKEEALSHSHKRLKQNKLTFDQKVVELDLELDALFIRIRKDLKQIIRQVLK